MLQGLGQVGGLAMRAVTTGYALQHALPRPPHHLPSGPATIPSSRDPFPFLLLAPFDLQLQLVLELQIRELKCRPPWQTRLQSGHHLLLRASGHQISKSALEKRRDANLFGEFRPAVATISKWI